MITISKPERGFLWRHWKAALGFLGGCFLVVGAMITLAYAEGVYDDPAGQLNNPFKLACDSGVIANRQVLIVEDGEYNWMFAKGQVLELRLSLNNGPQNNSVHIVFASLKQTLRDDWLHTQTDKIQWHIQIPDSGRWRLELIEYSSASWVNIYAEAGSSSSSGILGCFNPGDLFRTG